jgi:hypothetical protein
MTTAWSGERARRASRRAARLSLAPAPASIGRATTTSDRCAASPPAATSAVSRADLGNDLARLISGAVIMKITNGTSIKSCTGTTLIG